MVQSCFSCFGWPQELCGISGDKQLPCILPADAQHLQVIAAERLLDMVAWHAHVCGRCNQGYPVIHFFCHKGSRTTFSILRTPKWQTLVYRWKYQRSPRHISFSPLDPQVRLLHCEMSNSLVSCCASCNDSSRGQKRGKPKGVAVSHHSIMHLVEWVKLGNLEIPKASSEVLTVNLAKSATARHLVSVLIMVCFTRNVHFFTERFMLWIPTSPYAE